jgi:hypothetical protein
MLQTEISFFERITARKLQFCNPDPMIHHDSLLESMLFQILVSFMTLDF